MGRRRLVAAVPPGCHGWRRLMRTGGYAVQPAPGSAGVGDRPAGVAESTPTPTSGRVTVWGGERVVQRPGEGLVGDLGEPVLFVRRIEDGAVEEFVEEGGGDPVAGSIAAVRSAANRHGGVAGARMRNRWLSITASARRPTLS